MCHSVLPGMSSGLKFVLLIGLALTGSAYCVEPATESPIDTIVDSASVERWGRVSIDGRVVDNGQLFDTLDVYFETGGIDLAGYVLKLGLASQLLDVIDILPGEIIDSCGWDMFYANRVAPRPEVSQISDLWQITALAQIGAVEDPPVCFGFERPVSLARLVVSSVHVPLAPDTSVALFFYWETCGDNVLSDREGASIIISDTVVNFYPITFETERDSFPTCSGSPPECVSATATNKPRRLTEFRNGGVEFRLKIDSAEPDSGSVK